MLEGKVYSSDYQQQGNVLTKSDYDYIVSVGSKLAKTKQMYLHYFIGNMITPRYGFTFISKNILRW